MCAITVPIQLGARICEEGRVIFRSPALSIFGVHAADQVR